MFGEIGPKSRGVYQSGGLYLIQKIVLSSAQNSITFSNIPQNFNHLKIMLIARCSDAATNVTIFARFNNDSGTNYTYSYIQGIGASIGGGASAGQTSGYISPATAATGTANFAGVAETILPFYGNTIFNKTMVSYSCATSSTLGLLDIMATSWNNTAAINQITLLDGGGGNFIIGSSFCLYGAY